MRRDFTSRRCPKCNGNVFIGQDGYVSSEEGYNGWYEWCLQCGFRHYLQPTTVLMEELKVIPAMKEPASI